MKQMKKEKRIQWKASSSEVALPVYECMTHCLMWWHVVNINANTKNK